MKAGVYKHYSDLLVLVIGVARHSETEEAFVAYIPLGVKKGPRITVRPYKMFFEDVDIGGKKMPRFQYIDEQMPDELALKYAKMQNHPDFKIL